tara:strand:- start:967 stop:1575 length:609 start_codon:yes stop_codon:yes gene_type:complete
MFVLVESGSITKTLSGNKGITIGDIQYPQNIFTLWTASEKEAIGIYEVVWDNTNKKDEAYYTNTNQSFDFADGVATASFGSATAKELNDRNGTNEAGEELDPVVVIEGLKTKHKRIIKQQASGLLTPTDWYILKATDVESYSVPSAITTYRANVRTKSNDMEVLIDACSTVDELATLYKYVNTGTEENPVMERPLGEFPEAV